MAVTIAGCEKAKAVAKASYQHAKMAIANNWLLAKAKARLAVKRIRLAAHVLVLLTCRAQKLLWKYRKPVLLASAACAVIGLSLYFAGPYLIALATGAFCGGAAGAAAVWLPMFERWIPQRRMIAEPLNT